MSDIIEYRSVDRDEQKKEVEVNTVDTVEEIRQQFQFSNFDDRLQLLPRFFRGGMML